MTRLVLLATGAWQAFRASTCLFAKAIWLTSNIVWIAIGLILLIGPGVLIVLSGDYSDAGGWIFFYSGLALVFGLRLFLRGKASPKSPNSN
jgi:hypothetical protein